MERYVLEGNISVKAAVLGGVRPVYEILVDEQKKTGIPHGSCIAQKKEAFRSAAVPAR